jgi:pimeloyl-ACP methyl ester carboxylesterase
MTAPTSRTILANGLRHRVLEWAPASVAATAALTGVTGIVVMLHGYQDAASSFDEVAPLLAAAGLRVFAPDLRGFGDTDRVGAGGYYHFPDYVMDVLDLLDQLSPDAPVFLVGHSMGGTLAGMVAGAFPDRVALLALLEGVGPPHTEDEHAVDRVRAWVMSTRRLGQRQERPITLDEAARRLRSSHPNVDRAILRRRAEQLTRPAAGPTGEVSELLSWRFDSLHRTVAPIPFSVERWRSHARAITAPTLVVGGGETGFHPPDEAERIAAIPRARHVELDDAGHMMHWTRPTQLAALLIAFVRDGA